MTSVLIVIVLFATLNGLRGAGLMQRVLMAVLMGLIVMIFRGAAQPEYARCVIATALIWAAFIPAWSLGAITGVDDWADNFKPSAWVIGKLHLLGREAGAVGMIVRWLLFLPALMLTTGWVGVGTGIILAVDVAVVYWMAGETLKDTRYGGYATRIAEVIAGGLLGLAFCV